MRILSLLLVTLSFLNLANAQETIKANVVDESGQVVGQRTIRDLSLCGSDLGPKFLAEGPIGPTGRLKLDCTSHIDAFQDRPDWPGSEVVTLVAQGPTKNRIDLVIVGDGY